MSSYRRVLGLADLPALLMATCLSRLAGRMFALAIVLYALARFDSPLLAGWLSFAALAPGLVASPIAGALLDRIGPARAIGVDMAASAILVTVLAALDRLGLAGVPALLALVMLFSLTSPLSAAGVRTLLPRLVPTDGLDRANALDTAIFGLVDVAGPALAGTLIGLAGPDPTLAVIAAAYAGAALCMSRVRWARGSADRAPPLLRQALDGLAYVVRQPTLRGLAVSYALYQVTWGILVVAVPVFAVRSFAAGTADVVSGLLWAGLGVAGGTGALIAGHLRTAGRERALMTLGMIATALAAWPVAAAFGVPGLVLGLMLVGAAAGPIDVAVLTLRQRRTDPARLGRVLSVSISLNNAGMPIGSALAGLMIQRSLTASFVMAALASAIAAAAAAALLPVREADDFT